MALTAALPFHRPSRSYGKLAGEAALGLGLLAAGGFAAFLLREKATEEAAHEVLERDGAFSLRRYKPLTVAEVFEPGRLYEAMNAGFDPLARYIFAQPGGREGSDTRRIAMTAPVTAVPDIGEDEWTVRFTMPRDWDRADLPEPGGDVRIAEVPARTVAAIRFAGRTQDRALLARKQRLLLDWVAQRGMIALGQPEFAGYNSPVIPGFLRRNEWWVEVDWAEGPLDN